MWVENVYVLLHFVA